VQKQHRETVRIALFGKGDFHAAANGRDTSLKVCIQQHGNSWILERHGARRSGEPVDGRMIA
jgi:hypothetical protein